MALLLQAEIVMNHWNFVFRSLIYYRRSHYSLIAAIACTACILTGALLLGATLKGSLNQLVAERVGRAHYALYGRNHFFSSALADSLTARGLLAAPVIYIQGEATPLDNSGPSMNTAVYGVDNNFFKMGLDSAGFQNENSPLAYVNRAVLSYGLQPGSKIRLKVRVPRPFNTDALFAGGQESSLSIVIDVNGILEDRQMGRFSLDQNHYEQPAIFMPLSFLSRKLKLQERSNLLLISQPSSPISPLDPDSVIKECWQLGDGGYSLDYIKDRGVFELRSNKIFFPASLGGDILNSVSFSLGYLTYFVNALSMKGPLSLNKSPLSKNTPFRERIPYSFVSTSNTLDSLFPIQSNSIVLNTWSAQELNAKPGDTLTLTYFTHSAGSGLLEDTTTLIIHSIIPMDTLNPDTLLMPAIPGFTDALSCRHWDPGVPIDLQKIKKQDEVYWEKWRGTPKAYIHLNKAQTIWNNRFGAYTGFRIPATPYRETGIRNSLKDILTPERSGTRLLNLRQEGAHSVGSSVDFGGLFIGLSFFILAGALMLTTLLFILMIDQRSHQLGTLGAIGFSRNKISALMLSEGLVLATLGCLAGIILSLLYQQVLVWALNSFWQDITTSFKARPLISAPKLLMGFFITLAMVPAIQWFSLRLKSSLPVSLWSRVSPPSVTGKGLLTYTTVFVVLLLSLCIIMVKAVLDPQPQGTVEFFIIGIIFMALVAVIVRLSLFGISLTGTFTSAAFLKTYLSRKSSRSMLILCMMQISTFIILTVGLHHRSSFTTAALTLHNSGAGGYTYIGKSSISHSEDDIKALRGSLPLMAGDTINWMNIKVRQGDDASCLNITRALRPEIFGVREDILHTRGAFSFSAMLPAIGSTNPWQFLSTPLGKDIIPAIADQTVIQWGLGKKVGDTLSYVNSLGEEIKMVLAAGLKNSIFQGKILISQNLFEQYFPDIPGYAAFLMDFNNNGDSETMPSGTDKFYQQAGDLGIHLTPTPHILSNFARVENTYLAIFFMLGVFGILLGTLGLGAVILKSARERVYDYALLRAVGFTNGRISFLLWGEHVVLLCLGLAGGIGGAVITILPNINNIPSDYSLNTFFIILAGLGLNGLFWITLTTIVSRNKSIITGLRTE